MVTGAVAIIVDHVEDVVFSTLVWVWTDVVWTINIKVVVDADINVIITSVKAGKDDKTRKDITIKACKMCREETEPKQM